jgi:hypothetical protein
MIGVLAQRWCGLELEVQVLKSSAGHYLGTCIPGETISRESQEYYRTYDEAQHALTNNTFTQRTYP